ncbi:MAG: GNAT family N-acetyltransferase [Burkholderiaceae bacterium]
MFDPASIPAHLRAIEGRVTDALAARIEDASLAVAQPAQQSFFDGWLLRYSPGKAKRARSINSIGAGVLPFAEKLAHCVDFYQHHRLPCLFRITPFSQPHGVDADLAAADFEAHQDTRVMALSLSNMNQCASPSAAQSVTVEQFTTAFCMLHGLDAAKARAERERYARTAARAAFVVQFDGDTPVACGSLAMEGKFAGIFGMVTAAEFRGRGVATAIVHKLLYDARAAGAETAYLQVEAANAPARRAYSKFGFRDRYAYWYRAPPGCDENL